MFEKNYSSCTGRSSENICSREVEVLMEKERQGETQKIIKIDGFLLPPPPIECLCTFL